MTTIPSSTADLSAAEKRALIADLLRRKAAQHSTAPLSFAQERIWFLSQLAPESPFYNLPVAVRLHGALDRGALQRALDAVVDRQAALRTRFVLEAEHPVQRVEAPSPVPLRVIELDQLPVAAREIEARRLREEEARRPFDLARDLMVRALLLQLGGADYQLLVVMHHIASDAWSAGIFLEDLRSFYEAFVAGRAASLAELPTRYADYAGWQRQPRKDQALELELAYWKQQLAGDLHVFELPSDRPRPAVQSFRGGWEPAPLPQPIVRGIEALSRRENVTSFMISLAAFQTLLHRYSGQDDILVGSPVAGRSRVELEPLIGVFGNTLLLRTDCSGDPTFRELLGRVRATVLGALAHQGVPFEKLVEELQPHRDLSQSPFFQVQFVLQNVPWKHSHWAGLSVSPLGVHNGTTKLDLTFLISEILGVPSCYAEYATDLFDPATIRRLLGHYQVLLEGVVADPDRRLSRLPLLTPSERHQVLVDWNQTGAEFPRPHTLAQLFEDQVERTPEATAVVFEERRLTYRELNCRANQLAHRLQKSGVGPDRLAGICAERSPELVIGLLGILKAGGAYVPLDPGYPKERLRFMLEDAQVPVLLTQQHLATALPVLRAPTIYLDADWPQIAEEPEWNPANAATPDSLAYVIYTSGSTGKPKGAMNVHRGVCNRLLWMQDAYRLTAEDRVLQKTPFSFDVSVWEFFWPLLVGARLVLARPAGHQDGAYLARCIRDAGITTVHFVPSMLNTFLGEPDLERSCASLRRVICSGEALAFELQERFFARLPCALHNLYGPTEASIDVTAWTCERNSQRRLVPIGRPIANTQIYILDRYGQPTPPGIPGELHIGGVGLARGYWNRPDLTAGRFISCPLTTAPGNRLYKTGDRARFLPDGAIEFLGRVDHQVKLRGHRIELGEIETALSEHPDVQQAVAVVRDEAAGDRRLVAYYVPDPDRAVTAGDLRRFLQTQLPEYAVPSALVALDRLPLTPSGKLDRQALPAPDAGRESSDQPFLAPRTPTEEALANIWRDVLHVRQVGVGDDFFELGGHSLLVAQVLTRVRQAFQVELPMRRFFQTPTVSALASAIEEIVVAEISRLPEDRARLATAGMAAPSLDAHDA